MSDDISEDAPRESSSRSQSRPKRPRPPSTRPPSSLRAAKRADSHKAYVELANLQMARTRQDRIRSALQDQVDRSSRRIRKIDEKIDAVKEQIEQNESAPSSNSKGSADDEAFEYEY